MRQDLHMAIGRLLIALFCSVPVLQANAGLASAAACPTGLARAISTTTGCVQGIVSANDVGSREMFLGIPYAKPPKRFSRAEAPTPWTTPLLADHSGPACVQYPQGSSSNGQLPAGPFSEDCLTLNVWRPVNAKGLPVLFFIHGGGYDVGGGSATVLADNPDLAKNAIVVTFNYRLGAAGIIAHRELSAENVDHVSGNLGYRDMHLALNWVHANAESLGGNPNHVTIFGQSSGGGAVIYLLTSPEAQGLFSSAIIQSSGPYMLPAADPIPLNGSPISPTGQSLLTGESFGDQFAAALGCADPVQGGYPSIAACMRAKRTDELQKAWANLVVDHVLPGGSYVGPMVDGILVKGSPRKLINEGKFAHVPIIMGAMTEEQGAPWLWGFSVPTWTVLNTKLLVSAKELGIKDATRLIGIYKRPSEYASPGIAYANFLHDSQYLCGTRALLQAAASQGTPTYGYHNSHGPSFTSFRVPAHAMDLYFNFGSAQWKSQFTEAELRFASTLQSAWVSMAIGAPTVTGLGAWPQFAAGTWVGLDLQPKLLNLIRDEQCRFFDSQGIYFP